MSTQRLSNSVHCQADGGPFVWRPPTEEVFADQFSVFDRGCSEFVAAACRQDGFEAAPIIECSSTFDPPAIGESVERVRQPRLRRDHLLGKRPQAHRPASAVEPHEHFVFAVQHVVVGGEVSRQHMFDQPTRVEKSRPDEQFVRAEVSARAVEFAVAHRVRLFFRRWLHGPEHALQRPCAQSLKLLRSQLFHADLANPVSDATFVRNPQVMTVLAPQSELANRWACAKS